MFLSLILLFLLSTELYSVTTKYLGDLKFEKLEDYTLSNISFLENGTIELSPEMKEIFSTEEMIWSFDEFKDGILIGTGEKASLLLLNEKERKEVFSSKEHILFSDIKVMKNKILVSALPGATLFVLNDGFKVEMSLSFSNQYIWKILPYRDKIIVLSGCPAQIYVLDKNFKVESTLNLKNERNLLGGTFIKDELYFYSDSNILYKLELKGFKLCALFPFDDNITDIASDDERLYVLTGIAKAREIQKKEKKNQSSVSSDGDSDISNPITTERTTSSSTTSFSRIYRFDIENGVPEEIFKKSSISFLSMSIFNNRIFIATDKDASFYEFDIKASRWKFTNLGRGKFLKMLKLKNELYAILLEPSRVYKINYDRFERAGSLISTVFDCDVKSAFGKPIISLKTPKKTEVKLYTKSGAVQDEAYWEEWKSSDFNSISSTANRFIKYRLELFSDGFSSPSVNRLFVPYVQYNVSPYIEKFEINQQGSNLKFSWQTTDENKDNLVFDLFLSYENLPFFGLNNTPIEDNYFEISKELLGDGMYFAKLVASDRKSNDIPKENSKVIGPFLIDNTPPLVSNLVFKKNSAEFTVVDNLSPVLSVNYSFNGKKWERLVPVDNIYDSKEENFIIKLDGKENFLLVKVMDINGNASVIRIK
ncbi:MAG: hypothetical protein ACP5QT_04705 [Brevinematia bacterium]